MRFSAKQWELAHSEDWQRWNAGPSATRVEQLSLLARAVQELTTAWASHPQQGEPVVKELPRTLARCNELAFTSEAETLAYSIWHLTDRYARVTHVLDELFARGHLPLRRKRLSALEIGAGPSPALHAIRDYYSGLARWASDLGSGITLVPATHLLSLDRGAAWSHFVHALAEQQMALDQESGPHWFGITYSEFRSFSVYGEHVKTIEDLARAIVSEADDWDEYIPLAQARDEAASSHAYPPSAMDFIVLCNFLTETDMTREFEAELAELAESLSPGGVLLVLGSAARAYEPIFDEVAATVTRSGAARPILDIVAKAPHPDRRVRVESTGVVYDGPVVSVAS